MSRARVLSADGQTLWPRPVGYSRHSFAPSISPPWAAPPAPARFSHQRTRALRKLVLREDASLSSPTCGCLAPGTSLLVLREGRGTRVYVGADFAEGVRPLGWVTREKGGETFLSAFEAPVSVTQEFNCSPLRASAPRSPRSPRSPGMTISEESLATRIAKRRRERGAARDADCGLTPLGSRLQRSPPGMAAHEQGGKADGDGDGLGGLLSPAKLLQTARGHQAAADRAEPKGRTFETFASTLGRIVQSSRVDEMVTALDRNSNGEISKFEFSVGVRKILDDARRKSKRATSTPAAAGGASEADLMATGGSQERVNIEALFDRFDLDGSGNLSEPEVKKALKSLEVNVREVEAQIESAKQSRQKRLDVARAFSDAANETQKLEDGEKHLATLRHPEINGTLGVRLGAVLARRNLKVGDIIREWDEDSSGTIDPKEFRGHLKTLGVRNEAQECTDLFLEYDQNGDGVLEMSELRTLLTSLHESAKSAAIKEKGQAKAVAELRKAARAAQAAAAQVETDYKAWAQQNANAGPAEE